MSSVYVMTMFALRGTELAPLAGTSDKTDGGVKSGGGSVVKSRSEIPANALPARSLTAPAGISTKYRVEWASGEPIDMLSVFPDTERPVLLDAKNDAKTLPEVSRIRIAPNPR
jgi:hypothetical protein